MRATFLKEDPTRPIWKSWNCSWKGRKMDRTIQPDTGDNTFFPAKKKSTPLGGIT
jgi:hypothetical protein